MKNIQVNVKIGGIFSKFIRSISEIVSHDYNKFILNTQSCAEQNYNKNYFSTIFNFNNISIDTFIDCNVFSVYTNILQESNILSLKKAAQSLEINSHILKNTKNYIEHNLTDSVLGVHIRLTDMHTKHPNYGILTLDSFINHIDRQLNTNKYNSIFVSSDNKESIVKLKTKYGNLIKNFDTSFIVDKENDDNYSLQINNLQNDNFWNEVFINMLILSKSKHLIHRASDYANTTLLFSNTIESNTLVTP